jgi:hypothetical protein
MCHPGCCKVPVCCKVLHRLPQALRLYRPQRVAPDCTEHKAEVIRYLHSSSDSSGNSSAVNDSRAVTPCQQQLWQHN